MNMICNSLSLFGSFLLPRSLSIAGLLACPEKRLSVKQEEAAPFETSGAVLRSAAAPRKKTHERRKMKTSLITSLALAGWTAAAAEPQTNGTVAVRDVFSAGADFRIRQEIMDNLPGMPGDAYSATPALRAKYRNQIRFRPRVWFAAETGPFRLYARVADEFREYPTLHTPREERAYNFPDEVFLDNLYLEGRGLSVAGLETIDFRIGRQDLMEGGHSIYGLDRIIVEGTPTDGSRNFYSDMVRATLHFDAAKKLDVFALYDSGRSDLRWGNSRSRGRSLNCINMTDTSDLDEWGGGLVYSQNAFDGDLPFKVYAMFKRDEAHTTQKPAPRRVSAKERTTFGVFLEPRLTDNWDLELEAAQQVGRIVDSGRFAGGTMAHAAVNYRMDALRTYRPTLTWATTYYSGDSDCTKDGAADRAWDPVWARSATTSRASSRRVRA